MKRYLGLDLGIKSLGISISDTLGIAHPKENFNFSVYYYILARVHVIDILKEENINDVVLGLPLQIDRNEGERCKSVRRFAADLKTDYPNINIYFQDESYSTIEARERLQAQGMKEEKIKKIIDMMSAVVILEDFLNNRKEEK